MVCIPLYIIDPQNALISHVILNEIIWSTKMYETQEMLEKNEK